MKNKVALLFAFILINFANCMFAENDEKEKIYKVFILPDRIQCPGWFQTSPKERFFLSFTSGHKYGTKTSEGWDLSGKTFFVEAQSFYTNVPMNSDLVLKKITEPSNEPETIYVISVKELLEKLNNSSEAILINGSNCTISLHGSIDADNWIFLSIFSS